MEVDVYGDAVMNCNVLPGDSWRHRHDNVKTAIATACSESRLPVDCEVYGLFSNQISASEQAPGVDMERGILDFRLRMPTPEDTNDCLAELKITSD